MTSSSRSAAGWRAQACEAVACIRRAKLEPPLPVRRAAAWHSAHPALQSSSHHDARGSFAPDWPLQCFFSKEYLDDLLDGAGRALAAEEAPQGATSSAAAPAASAGQQQRRLRAAGQGSSAGGSGAVAGAQVHAQYAAVSSGRAAQAATAADALLAPVAGGGAGNGEGAGASLPPAALRSHWLLRLQLEWEALTQLPLDLGLLALRRRQRRCVGGAQLGPTASCMLSGALWECCKPACGVPLWPAQCSVLGLWSPVSSLLPHPPCRGHPAPCSEVEALLDRACQQLAVRHRGDWGVLA